MNYRQIASIVASAAIAIGCGGDEQNPQPKTTTAPVVTSANSERLNSRPIIDRIVLSPSQPRPGELVRVRVDASDPDADQITLRYEWRVAGQLVSAKGSSLSVPAAAKNAMIEVAVVASDGTEQSTAARATARIGNRRPKIMQVVIEPLGSVTVEHDVTASPTSHDPDGDQISYRYVWLVNGQEVGDDGPVLARSHYKRGDRIEITIVASDGNEDSAEMVSDPIEVTNAKPRITSAPGAIDADGVFRYHVIAEDPDGDRLFQYHLLGGPTGMNLDIVSGLLEWAPAEDQAGSHAVKLEINDRNGGSANQSFMVEVAFETAVPASQAN